MSKVEAIAVLERLRFACQRLDIIPAMSLAASLPDPSHPHHPLMRPFPEPPWCSQLSSCGAPHRAEGRGDVTQRSADLTFLEI